MGAAFSVAAYIWFGNAASPCASAASVTVPIPGLTLQWPVDHADQSVITQTYAHFGTVVVNEYHTGLDIAPNPNTTLMAIAASTGEVIRIQQNGDSGCDAVPGGCSDHGYGNTVTLRHSVGNTTVYTQYS